LRPLPPHNSSRMVRPGSFASLFVWLSYGTPSRRRWVRRPPRRRNRRNEKRCPHEPEAPAREPYEPEAPAREPEKEARNSFVRQRAVRYNGRRKAYPFLFASTRQDKPCRIASSPPKPSRTSVTSPLSGAKSSPATPSATPARVPL